LAGAGDGILERAARWLEGRLGLSTPVLRPVPRYAINPFYWLGALTVVAFVIQGVTGVMMMLYYVPSPSQAYASTQYIFENVSYGRFLETVHLYTAYAMIFLALMHFIRGYFVSVQKKPRELMWVVGMVMGIVTLGFGFTGYLLPWSVVSKAATDVGVGMMAALPPQISSFVGFLIAGAGGDATELLHFYNLHVVVLPVILLVLLAAKMYMLEAHGISEPATGAPSEREGRPIPMFPDVTIYLFELAAVFGAAMMIISVLFPLNLPPQYSAQAAGSFVAQPDWYFLWIYQVLKISAFETAGLPVALTVVTAIFAAFFLLPFIDRGELRKVSHRPRYATLGLVFLGEWAILTVWGYLTPGQVISNEEGLLVLGGTALLIALLSWAAFRLVYSRASGGLPRGKVEAPHSSGIRTTAAFCSLLAAGALSLGGVIDGAVNALGGSASYSSLELVLVVASLAVVLLATAFFLYGLERSSGTLRRRIGWMEERWG